MAGEIIHHPDDEARIAALREKNRLSQAKSRANRTPERLERDKQTRSKYYHANKDKEREYLYAWREKNKERFAEYRAKWKAQKTAEGYFRAKYAADPNATKKATQQAARWRNANPEKFQEGQRRWLAANMDRKKAKDAQWRLNNLERRKASFAAWKKNNPAKVKENAKRYLANHPEIKRVVAANYRARKQNAEGRHSRADIKAIAEAQRHRCGACRISVKRGGYHVDHIIPLARGGGNGRRNLQLLCAPCNWQKNSQDPIEFMQSRGFLL